MWSLPVSVDIDGTEYKIRNKCDYRVVLDVISALNDRELEDTNKIQCALYIFYEDLTGVKDIQAAVNEMIKIINLGEDVGKEENNAPRIMDWEHDFNQLAPPINRVLGYSIRDANHYTHWFDFVGAYMEIGGECTFATIISIRSKRAKGKKLEDYERQFYNDNKKLIDLSQALTGDEKEWLESDW